MKFSEPVRYKHVPKYVFKSPGVWILHEMMKMRLIQATVAVGFMSTVYCYLKDAFPLATLVAAYPLLYVTPSPYVQSRSKRVANKYMKTICEEVVREAPGMDIESWDNITERINELIYLEGDWPSRYCLFDGRNCYEVFRETVVCPYYKSQGNEEGTSDRTESYQDSRDVVAAYEKSLDRWWEYVSSGLKHDTFKGTSQQKLPQSIHRNRFSWLLFLSLKTTILRGRIFFFNNITDIVLPLLVISSLPLIAKLQPFYLPFLLGQCFGAIISQILTNFLTFALMRSSLLGVHHLMSWWKIISDINPGEDVERWDIVAKTFNGLWDVDDGGYLKEFFFDGKDCMRMFRKLYSEGYLENHNCTKLDVDMSPFLEKAIQALSHESLH